MAVKLEVPVWIRCQWAPSALRLCMPPPLRRRPRQCQDLRVDDSACSWLAALGRQRAAPHDNRFKPAWRMVDRVCEAVPDAQAKLNVSGTRMELVVAGVDGT